MPNASRITIRSTRTSASPFPDKALTRRGLWPLTTFAKHWHWIEQIWLK